MTETKLFFAGELSSPKAPGGRPFIPGRKMPMGLGLFALSRHADSSSLYLPSEAGEKEEAEWRETRKTKQLYKI
jgi:hypothetical protein